MNEKIFDPLICGASISEQHLQTELHQEKWYQLGIKTLNKIQKHWSELNNECIPMQQSVFAFFTWGASNSEQLLNTELCQDRRNQVLMKTSPKSRNVGQG